MTIDIILSSFEKWWNKYQPNGLCFRGSAKQGFTAGYQSRDIEVQKLREALIQILDDGNHIVDYGPNDELIFNKNGKQGYYCYAAAEQAIEALNFKGQS